MFKNLIDINNLSKEEIDRIIEVAKDFEAGNLKSTCKGKHLALMFFENSTRTHFSFEMAANKLGINVYNFDTAKSSFSKGETVKDTLENLCAIGMNGIVIRHQEAGFVEKALCEVGPKMTFINAGDGNRAHPTQALLDYYTMKNHLGSIEGKKVAIIGDIRHSRVAHSNVKLLKKYGADIYFCAPKYFKDDTQGVTFTDKLEVALKDADVAMFLRVQNERLEDRIPIFDYVHEYGLTMKKLRNFAKEDVLIMHPGPVNRDVEISSEILDSEYGKTILEQARNGVFVRMAVLELLMGEEN